MAEHSSQPYKGFDLTSRVQDIKSPGYTETNTRLQEIHNAASLPPAYQQTNTRSLQAQIYPLPCPIILPQQRPRHRDRGFIRAYAPILQHCKDIDEATFLHFIDEFTKSSQASPILHVTNLAANVATLIPEATIVLTASVINVLTEASITMQSRYKTNTYLDRINESLFHPKNLHCMIVTYKPKASKDATVEVSDESEHLSKLEESGDFSSSMSDVDETNKAMKEDEKKEEKKKRKSKFRESDFKVRSEIEIPESAELVYHPLTVGFETSDGEQIVRKGFLGRKGDSVNRYLDRHAHTSFVKRYGHDSKLAVPGAASPNVVPRNDGSKLQKIKSVPSRVKQAFQDSVLYLIIAEMPQSSFQGAEKVETESMATDVKAI